MQSIHGGHASAKKFFNPTTAASYDSVVSVTTFGRDAAWKREIIKIAARSRNAGPVLDLACGTGILSSMLRDAGMEPAAGLDLTLDYMRLASRRMGAAGPLFAQGTAEVLPYRDGAFGAVVSSYLAKYVDVPMLVGECWRVLRPGGVMVMHDFTCPSSSAMRALWDTYFAVLRATGVLFARSWKPVFDDLDRVICSSRWAQQAVGAMEERGFADIMIKNYTGGTAAIVAGCRPA